MLGQYVQNQNYKRKSGILPFLPFCTVTNEQQAYAEPELRHWCP